MTPATIALVPTRLKSTVFGLPSRVGDPLAGEPVLVHTVARLARVKHVQRIVLIHDAVENPLPLLADRDFGVPVCGFVGPCGLSDPYQHKHAAARKWSLAAWRGGLGGATCYDELLPASSWYAAMEHHNAQAALIVGADWPLIDPAYCQQVIDLHRRHPKEMQLTFTQAPPGLGGIAIGRDLVGQMAKSNVSLGQIIAYNPAKPQPDPIGRDVCVQIPAAVRSFVGRFIFDTPATAAMIQCVVQHLGDRHACADAEAVTQVAAGIDGPTTDQFAHLPQMVTLELTPRRCVSGPATVQHHVSLDRADMPLENALRIVEQLGDDRSTVLTLGGLGDPLCFEGWDRVISAAYRAGVMGICVETDLWVSQSLLETLLALPIDVVSVRLNADTAQTYRQAMDPDDKLCDGFAKVIANLQWLINQRNRRTNQLLTQPNGVGRVGLPWVVPRLVKTAHTLDDMETFFDKWLYYAGHAVIEPATSGCGLAPNLSPVPMDPPGRFGCRQVIRRMTIHSDGRVAQCDQDWLGRACGGDAATAPLAQIWHSMAVLREAHDRGQWDQLSLCASCHEWHRP